MAMRFRLLASLLAPSLAACGPPIANDSGAGESDEASSTDTEVGEDTSDLGESETGSNDECLLAIRLDLCCNQAFPATAAEVEADPCVVVWPIDWESLPPEVVSTCTAAQPEWCETVDCDFAEPASEMVGPTADGGCEYLCPEDLHLAYQNPGCEQPIVACLGTPPPCADEYCSCEGETIWGCGQVGEPFEHVGPCE